MFENRLIGRAFGPRRNDITGELSKLTNEELNHLYFSPYIIWVIKSRRMRWAGHVARMRRGEFHAEFLYGNLIERDYSSKPRWQDNIKMDLQEVGCGQGLD